MKPKLVVALLAQSIGLFVVEPALAQGLTQPLNIQGLERPFFLSSRSRGMGGTATSSAGDASAIFSNPAGLSAVQSLEFRAGASFTNTTLEQKGEWIPDRRYAGLSIMFENDFTGIKDSALQKPFDDILPGWEQTSSSSKPTMIAGAMPLEIGGMHAALALGLFQAADLDYYYQNNNVLDPNIGAFRPEPILAPQLGDTIGVQWFQSVSERSGTLYGITPGLSLEVSPGISLGVAATITTGQSEDVEARIDRGYLRIATSSSGSGNVFFVDPILNRISAVTTSEYSGVSFNLGALWRQEYFSIGLSVRPPFTTTRDWNRTVLADTTGRSTTLNESGSDELRYPIQYSVGMTIHATEAWDISIDYRAESNSSVTYATSDSSFHPWVGGPAFRFGAEYRVSNWLSLRGGYREEVQTFSSEGSGLLTEPVRGSTLSFGAGLTPGTFGIELAYEIGTLSYQDMWISNVNTNTRTTHRLTCEFFIRI